VTILRREIVRGERSGRVVDKPCLVCGVARLRLSHEVKQLQEPTPTKRRKSPVTGNELPSDPGFTWELLCITLLFLSFLAAVAVFLVLLANGENPGLLISITALILCVLTLKLTPWLSNKYRAHQRLLFLSAGKVIENDTCPPVLYCALLATTR
jgi:hypothetical protein